MSARDALTSRFTRNLFGSAGLVALGVILFVLYLGAEARVDRANELRYRSYVLADELRQSGDDLTRMVRTYAVTGDPAYREYFQEILDIRDGRKPRPENYSRPYWDLVLVPGSRPRGSDAAVPLLELMRQAGFTEEEFAKLAQAKASSDALTGPELEAMRLLESAGPDAAANRRRAIEMLFDEPYHRAKQSVMQPIDEFFEAVDWRTLAAVQEAKAMATALRNALVADAAAVLFMLWRSYVALNATMGGSVGAVYAAIARVGSRRDAPPAVERRADGPGSVLAWLAAMQARLGRTDRERDEAQQRVTRANRALRMLYAVSEEVARAKTADAVIQHTCDIAVDQGGYRLAWVGCAGDAPEHRVQVVAHAGADGDYLGSADITWADEPRGRGPTGRAIRERAPQIARDIANDPSLAPWREHALLHGYASSAALPVMAGDRAWGALCLYSERPDAFDEEEMRMLASLAADLGFALEAIEARDKTRRASEALVRAREELRQLNAELEQRVANRTAQLEAANKDLEGFSYSVSHDLRTPLRAVDTFSALLLEEHAGQLDAEGRHLLDVIRRNTDRMGRLISDMLDFSRAGSHEPVLTPLPVEPLAREVMEELQLANAGHAAFEVTALPPAFADRTLIRQVLHNLLGNALKYTATRDDARITLRGRVENGETLYEVSDNGVGFDPRYAGKLFGVFQRLHGADEFPGTGIGLAIVKRIVAKHGGRVWAESRPGAGATFGFSLPRLDAAGAQGGKS